MSPRSTAAAPPGAVDVFTGLVIGDGAAFGKWQADARNREVMRFLKLQLARAPFSSVVDANVEASTEYTLDGVKAVG